jgi:hypothetical protein
MTNAVNLSALGSNGGTSISTWTTGTRPSSPLTGQFGFNATLGSLEVYNGTAWATAGGLNTQAVQTTGFTAVAGNIYPCNTTSAAFTVTLPASPTAGNQIQIIDYAGTFATNNVTLGRNGSNITGVADNYLLKTNRLAVILTYIDATQGWVVSSAAYSTTPIMPTAYTASYLIVAGGGGGGPDIGGGGGAGGYLTGTSSLTVGTTYSFTVGAGSAQNTQGSNSTGLSLTAIGGGHGSGGNGGSGGGCRGNGAFGLGTAGQGNNGNKSTQSQDAGAGGGGGAGAVGGLGNNSASGNGGVGLSNSITGSAVFYAGGGGGGGYSTFGVAAGSGGNGGGANGLQSGQPSAATANTGGGGGGGGVGSTGGTGGSGVVILSVPTANYSGTTTGSPTITTSGSNTIIKFNSSGSYTA